MNSGEETHTLTITEMKKIPTYPFVVYTSVFLKPRPTPPYDVSYWRGCLQSAIDTYWMDQKQRLRQVAADMEGYLPSSHLAHSLFCSII